MNPGQWVTIEKEPAPTLSPAVVQRIQSILKTLSEAQFTEPPAVTLSFVFDAATKRPEETNLAVNVSGARSDPWGRLDSGRLSFSSKIDETRKDLMIITFESVTSGFTSGSAGFKYDHGSLSGSCAFRAGRDDTHFESSDSVVRLQQIEAGNIRTSSIGMEAHTSADGLEGWASRFRIVADDISGPLGSVPQVTAHMQFEHNHTGRPASGAWEWLLSRPQTPWGEAQSIVFSGTAEHQETKPLRSDETWGWWAVLEPFYMTWKVTVSDLVAPNLSVPDLNLAGLWSAPKLTIDRFESNLYGGHAHGAAKLDVATRDVTAQTGFNMDVRQIAPLLNEKGKRWLGQFGWEHPPQVDGQLRVRLPEWTDFPKGWATGLASSLWIDGKFESGAGSFRGIPIDSARSHFNRSNYVWTLPDLHATRPEGEVDLNYRYNVQSKEFRWELLSRMDPRALHSVLPEAARHAVDEFGFTEPPTANAVVTGNWYRPKEVSFHALVNVTNFFYRTEPVNEFSATIDYTDGLLTLTDAAVRQGERTVTAPALSLSTETGLLYLTNLTSTVNPKSVIPVIGPKTARALEPYHFHADPIVRLTGRIDTRNLVDTDATFIVSGGAFSFWKFNVPAIEGRVHWISNSVVLTDVSAPFYQGRLTGDFRADFDETGREASIRFKSHIADVNCRRLMDALVENRSAAEGKLAGWVEIVSGQAANPESWRGEGEVSMTNGYLWDVPLFSIFTPVLNLLVPGAGSSHGGEANARFTLRDGMLATDNLEMRETAVRLQYRGTVDFEGNVGAHVTAELLRDTWMVGKAVSLLFSPITKLFEYRVLGTLQDPKVEPLYLIPRVLLLPLRPLRSLLDLVPPAKPGLNEINPNLEPEPEPEG